MLLPKLNQDEKKEELETLKDLLEKSKKGFSLKRWYRRNFAYFWLAILITLLVVLIMCLIFAQIVILEISLIFSLIALATSTILFITKLMNYPKDDLTIKRLKADENYYELIFSIKNTGYGKLKLDYAIYFIECIEKDEDISSFLICDTEKMHQFFKKLIEQIEKDKIRIFSLKSITSKFHLFFTHDDIHTESRLLKFEEGKTYMITFLFQTSHKIYYYISKFLRP